MTEERIEIDFNQRDPQDQQELLSYTWCDQCQLADLGMTDPQEYRLNGIHFVEGRCRRCGQPVFTELSDDEF